MEVPTQDIKKAQAALRDKGYYTGQVDGVFTNIRSLRIFRSRETSTRKLPATLGSSRNRQAGVLRGPGKSSGKISRAILAAVNQHGLVQRFGSVQNLEIDPLQKMVSVCLLLKGV